MCPVTTETDFETVIGLEVHSQLLTRSKMFCRCDTVYDADPPNSHVCPVCLGMPGSLPTINRKAVELTMMTALAIHSEVSVDTKFDRKNYPYPDLVKGYQISQFDMPIGVGGYLDVEADGNRRRIGITRVHLEEDVGKLLHRDVAGQTYSLVDYNRAGMPLMEIVGEPDLRSPEEARQYLMQLRTILRYIGVSNANMEEGSFRCDANISIRPVGATEYQTKVEIKNMNSFRAVFRALEYEAKRQRKAARDGETIIQETRGWDEAAGKTVSQRGKEGAHDYRYFPEPDLPPLCIDREWVEAVRAMLPELPEARRTRFIEDYGLSAYDAGLLTASRELADYYEASLATGSSAKLPNVRKDVANWIIGECSRIMNAHNVDVAGFSAQVPPERFTKLILDTAGVINSATGKTVLEEMFRTGLASDKIIADQGLGQISDDSALDDAVAAAITDNPKAVADFKAGNEAAVKFLVGQVMRVTRGRANPVIVAEKIKVKLEAG
jgi:aspartyl-tRNA(Asn)/glutamyl-tRNA(Gln) amidotransferase subunit B